MPIARVSRLTLDGTMSANKRARISQLTLDGTAVAGTTKRARISRLGLTGNYVGRRARISELRFVGSTVTPLTPALSASNTLVEPGTTVTVSAADTTGNGVGTTWSITSGGSGVALSGSGLTRTLVAPRDPAGRAIVVQVDYTDMYGDSATRAVTVTVRPHQMWFCKADGSLLPVRNPFLRI